MNTQYDSDLKKIPFYQKHSQYLPFIGKKYSNKKILLLGESHYFPKDTKNKDYLTAKKWYSETNEKLSPDEKCYTNTSQLVECIKTKPFFRNIIGALRETKKPEEDVIEWIAFMNAFQRPAIHTKSLKNNNFDDEDIKVATETINQVIRIIKPSLCCFMSKFAYEKLHKKLSKGSKIERVAHPSCPWWNRSEGKHGRQKFIGIINNHILNKK